MSLETRVAAHFEWIDTYLATKRAYLVHKAPRVIAHDLCRSRGHERCRGSLTESCTDCRREVDDAVAVWNNERLPL